MKLRWYDRLLFALSGLVLIALGVGVILAVAGVSELADMLMLDIWMGEGWLWMAAVAAIGVVLVVWGLWVLIRPFTRGHERGGKYYTLQSESDGDVRISVHAIDHLVRRCIAAYAQVISARVRIGGQEDAMRVTLHLTVASEVNIPELIAELRAEIKASLQRSAGVTVETVEVYVDATRDDADHDTKRLSGATPERAQEARDPVNAVVFSRAPAVAVDEPAPQEAPLGTREPTVAELEREIDLGPDEPLPVNLSADAFPFPEEEAGVPLEIYTKDIPIPEDEAEGGAQA